MNEYYEGTMNPKHDLQTTYAKEVFDQIGKTSNSVEACEDKLTSLGEREECPLDKHVYFGYDCDSYRVVLVLPLSDPMDSASVEFLKIDSSESKYQKMDLADEKIQSLLDAFPAAVVKDHQYQGYDKTTRGMVLLTIKDIDINGNDKPCVQSLLASVLSRAINFMQRR